MENAYLQLSSTMDYCDSHNYPGGPQVSPYPPYVANMQPVQAEPHTLTGIFVFRYRVMAQDHARVSSAFFQVCI